MNRNLIIAVAACLTLLAVYLAWDREHRVDPSVQPPAAVSETARVSPATLASPDGNLRPRSTASLATWSVVVVDPDGAALDQASIKAHCQREERRATGNADWTAVTAGTWQLSVEADGFAPHLSRVALTNSETTRTIVQMGLPCAVAGRVRDTREEPLKDYLVIFLQPDQQAPTKANEFRSLPHAVTDRDGYFEIVLPKEGPWRPIVVYGGRVLLEAERHEQLFNGPTRFAEIVIPASSRLVTFFKGDTGTEQQPALLAFSVYRRPNAEDLAKEQALEVRRASIVAVEPDMSDPDTAEEVRRAIEHEDDPVRLAQIEKQKNWRRAAPAGWKSIGSSVVPEGRVIVFDRLPYDTELRFALRRDNEVFRVAQPAFLPYGGIVHATLELPDSSAADPDPAAPLRLCPIYFESPEGGLATLSEGVDWR